jgi:hypothetical protein
MCTVFSCIIEEIKSDVRIQSKQMKITNKQMTRRTEYTGQEGQKHRQTKMTPMRTMELMQSNSKRKSHPKANKEKNQQDTIREGSGRMLCPHKEYSSSQQHRDE